MNDHFAQIIASKRRMRETIAARPIGAKLRLLDAMRERDTAIRESRPADAAQLVEVIKNPLS